MKRKLTALSLSAICALSFCACGKRTTPNGISDIEINFWQSGFGVEFMNKIIEDFKAKYPDYNVAFNPNRSQTSVVQSLNDKEDDTVDLYFGSLDNLIAYEDMFEPLDDVYDTVVAGESVKIGDKFQDIVKNAYRKEDGHYYCMSYAGSALGILYNADIIDGINYTVPNTSDELMYLSLELSNVTGESWSKAWVHFQDSTVGYYNGLLKTWQAQYSGLDYYTDNWLTLTDAAGNSPSKEVYASSTDGRREALLALGKCVNPSTVYPGSNTAKFTSAQTYFVAGKAALMVNGSWIQNEMKASGGREFNCKMMKTPVISSIIDVLPDKSVSNDAELSALVTAIDAATEGDAEVSLTGKGYDVTQADWDRVASARRYMFHNGVDHCVILNKYSAAKEASKDFLRFYFSEAGTLDFANTIHQLPSAQILDADKVTTDDWTSFEKDMFDFDKTVTVINDGGINRSKLFRANGLNAYANISVIAELSASNPAALKTPETLWSDFQAAVEKNWTSWMWNAGFRE